MKHWIAGLLALVSVALGMPVASVAAGAEPGDAVAMQSGAAESKEAKNNKAPSDAQIRQILIDESIEAYLGNCPCPYSTARNGSRCGRRSAYSREGGEAPLCYAKDVSREMVAQYREAHAHE